MSGQNKVEFGLGDYLGGDYTFDKAFKEGPKEFKDFAKKSMEEKHHVILEINPKLVNSPSI